MTREERRQADALDRFWDAVQRDEMPRRPREMDDLTAAVVAHLNHDASTPNVAAPQLRVRQRIVSALAASEEDGDRAALSRSSWSGGDRTAPFDLKGDKQPRPRPASRVAAFTMAALVLFVIGAGYLVFETRRDNRPQAIPAVNRPVTPTPSSATPAPRATEQSLVTVSVPSEALGKGAAGSLLSDETVQPGSRTTWRTPQSVRLFFVFSGTIAIRPDGPFQVQRAGHIGTWEAYAAGASIDLGPGDAALMLHAASVEVNNAGTSAAEVLGWSVAAGASVDGSNPVGWIVHDQDSSGTDGVSLPGGHAILRLRRVDLPPAARLAMPPKAYLHQAVTRPGNAAGTPQPSSLAMMNDGMLVNAGLAPVSALVVTLEPFS